jgi:hypothetical protein
MFVFRHTPNDWKLSRAMLNEAADAITHDVQIVRDFDIPYVAGYSIDRKTFYIDHTLPRGFDLGDGDFFDVTMTLILHEAIEAALEKMLPSFPYEGAHQIAFQAEEVAVKAFGVDRKRYNDFFNGWIDKIFKRSRFENCPIDLDLEPYRDEEDWVTLDKMFHNGKPLWDGKKSHPGVD